MSSEPRPRYASHASLTPHTTRMKHLTPRLHPSPFTRLPRRVTPKCIIPLCIIICALLPATAAAQRTYSPSFSIGAKGGATFSTVAFSPSVEQSFKPGMTLGIQARYSEESWVGIVGEINFAQRGWAEKYDPGVPFSYSRTLSYIDIPVMTHIFFGPRKFKVFINLGPEVSFMLANSISANFDYAAATIPGYPANRRTEQLSMPIKGKVDYGITAGLGFEWKMNRRNSILFEARYYFGLGNIYPSSKRDVFSASRVTSIEATAGYLFRLK